MLISHPGFAFVYMEDERDAEDAIRALDRVRLGPDALALPSAPKPPPRRASLCRRAWGSLGGAVHCCLLQPGKAAALRPLLTFPISLLTCEVTN